MYCVKNINLFVAVSMVCLVAFSIGRIDQTEAASASISRSYHASNGIPISSIVSLKQNRSDYVEASNPTNSSRVIGIAVASVDSLLAINPNTGDTQIAMGGTVTTLVSTLNGSIEAGDQIAVSALNGVGAKAVAPGSRIVGLATASFNSTTAGATDQKIQDLSGKTHVVLVGYIPVTIALGTSSSISSTLQLSSLQKLVQSRSGQVVSTARIVGALLVGIISLTSLLTLVHGSIYGSIIAVGRNPLAKYVILRNLISVIIMAGFTLIIAGLIMFYLLH